MELKKLGKLYSSSFPATITKQISNIKSYEISYRTLHTKAIVNDYITGDSIGIPFMNIIDKYKDNFSQILSKDIKLMIDKTLNDLKPEIYKLVLEKTEQYIKDHKNLHLKLNNIQEKKPGNIIKIYDPDSFKEYINEILILEELV